MDKTVIQRSKYGIAVKTSLISGVIVLVLLGLSSIFLIKFQSKLIGSVISTYISNVNTAIDEQGAVQEADLKKAFQTFLTHRSGASYKIPASKHLEKSHHFAHANV